MAERCEARYFMGGKGLMIWTNSFMVCMAALTYLVGKELGKATGTGLVLVWPCTYLNSLNSQ